MGHKKPPRANRLGVWVKREKDTEPRMAALYDSTWFSEFQSFPASLQSDYKIRQQVIKTYGKKSGISKVHIARKDDKVELFINSIRPVSILGKDNQKIDQFRSDLEHLVNSPVKINVQEASPNDAQIVAEKIAYDLERRMPFRRSAKGAISKVMSSAEVVGVKVIISGRLGGAEIARTEWYLEGKVPLHTWYTNIDYGFAEAETTYGIIGIKVLLNKSRENRGGKQVQS